MHKWERAAAAHSPEAHCVHGHGHNIQPCFLSSRLIGIDCSWGHKLVTSMSIDPLGFRHLKVTARTLGVQRCARFLFRDSDTVNDESISASFREVFFFNTFKGLKDENCLIRYQTTLIPTLINSTLHIHSGTANSKSKSNRNP